VAREDRWQASQPAFSRDGKRLLLVTNHLKTDRGTARVCDPAGGGHFGPPIPSQGEIVQAVLSPDGDRVVMARLLGETGTTELCFYEVASGKPYLPPVRNDTWAEPSAFGPGGRLLLVTSRRRVAGPAGPSREREEYEARVWDANTGRPAAPPLTCPAPVVLASFSPDGRRVLTVSRSPWGKDGTARLWDTATGKPVTRPLPCEGSSPGAPFSPDGRRLLTVRHTSFLGKVTGTVRTWDVRTGAAVGPRVSHEGSVLDAALSPDGRRLVTVGLSLPAGSREVRGQARVWDAATGEPVTGPLRLGGVPLRVLFSPDGRRFATLGSRTTPNVPRLEVIVGGIDEKPEVKGGEVRVWDAATGDPVTPPLRHDHPVVEARFSGDGRRLFTVAKDYQDTGAAEACVWDAYTGQPVTPFYFHEGPGRPLFHPDGRLLVRARKSGVTVIDLSEDARPAEHLIRWAQLLGGRKVDRSASVALLGPEEMDRRRRALWAAYPRDFTCPAGEVRDWHLREAEHSAADGHFGGTLWHLDRLLTEDPEDVEAYALRARARAAVADWGGALADFTRAAARGARGADVWFGKGLAHLRRGEWAPARDSLSRAVERNPRDWQALYFRGLARLRLGLKREAAADCAQALRLGPEGAWPWFGQAVERLQAGDAEGYRLLCASLLERFRTTDSPRTALTVAATCLLAPRAVDDPGLPVALAERAARQLQAGGREDREDADAVLGAAYYRAGRFKDAAEILDRASGTSGEKGMAWCWLFSGMARQRLGETAKAKGWLDKAVRAFEQFPADGDTATSLFRMEVSGVHALLRQELNSALKK
jgi:WD40 repeat protein/tetratricopeptide (TPR) repeat protein